VAGSGTTAVRQQNEKKTLLAERCAAKFKAVDYRLGAARADKLGRNNRRELARYGPRVILKQFEIV